MPTLKQFTLPDAGEGLTEAEIVSWKVKAGDVVAVNDVLVEIETAKSLVELPSPFAGVVAELHVPEGATVDVGTPIVSVDVDPSGAAQQAGSGGSGEGGTDEAGSGAVLVGYGTRTPAARRRRVVRPPHQRTAVPAEPVAVQPDPSAPAQAGPAQAEPAPEPAGEAAGTGVVPERVLAKPPVRKLARDLGVDLAQVRATGPGGTVTREDVLTLANGNGNGNGNGTAPAAAAAPATERARRERERHVPIRGVRRATARAMVESAFSAPHVTVFATVDVTRTMKLVRRLKEDPNFAGVRISPLLIVAKALLVAVRRNPEVNATWDDEAQVIVVKDYVNLGIAAATPRGLLVPNVKDADAMGMRELAEALGELTRTAREGRTSPADTADGTITITNVGVFGIDTGTPILNPGEAAILALGRIAQQPAVHKGKVKPRWLTTLGLSFDHRMVDGELGSRFLADIAAVLEDPARALTWN
ncbi:pyruvate dehydrogenase E2 component (dihydrolipoamide acetyltransferase) [Kineococcus xinjiangensis]|uniref:Dihydrolipoamide acetyltransferase component of pyruvate dehydrogenase complex n=1 Tax=Kineococcus xinjiangensis TaxID=512762 RepID=A0A2S6IV81_9ACTN|nr:dihydrolipoamide acetyltransferase family protein [Kineococcus xinjiangensis]PPK98118.1 pyruvate dehydrogenase E2 component (dihydrolipoamide acetyltransferase) [Kineococcus xinjiangensis]